MLEEILTFLYVCVGILGTIAFYPQLRRVIKDHTGSHSTSLLAYGFWSFELFISSVYAVVVNADVYFILISFLGFLGFTAIFSIALFKRITYSRHHKLR